MTEHIEKVRTHIHVQFKYIVGFFILFTMMSWSLQALSNYYYRYYDKTKYYDITNPVTVERKQVVECSFVDAYIHRKVLVPIQGTSVKQLTLIRENDGKSERIQSFTTDIQADVGEATMIAHWALPCGIPVGTYYFEGTVAYKVNDYTKYTHFITETFQVMSTASANLLKIR